MIEPSYTALRAATRRAELSTLARLEEKATHGLTVADATRLRTLRLRYAA